MKRIASLLTILILPATLSLLIGCAGTPRATHENLNAVLWMQRSGEYDALCRQAFLAAHDYLDDMLADSSQTAAIEQTGAYAALPPAIITDMDETIVDNSPFQAWATANNAEYNPKDWNRWVQQAAAKPLPGAVEFLRYAASRGVTIFYVTNRDSASEAATRENLIKDDFAMTPGIDNVLLVGEHGWNSEKAGRRMFVAEHYRIVMLMGDDLGDFIAGVRDSTDEGRVAAAQAHRERWGKQWIILPNPTYGGWESALFKGVTPKPDDAGKLKVKYGKLEQMR